MRKGYIFKVNARLSSSSKTQLEQELIDSLNSGLLLLDDDVDLVDTYLFDDNDNDDTVTVKLFADEDLIYESTYKG